MKKKIAARLWKRLEQICMSKTLTSKLHMKQRLYAHRLEESASEYEHLTVFKEILSNLEDMKVQYDKGDLGLILLYSLPPSYSTFRDTMYITASPYRDKIGILMMIVERHRNEILAINLRVDRSLQTEGGCESKGKTTKNSGEADVVKDYSDGELLVASINNSKCSTITDDAVVASSSLSDDDITELWHMRLGHMCENDMTELSKRGLLDGKVWAFFLKQKSDVFFAFKSWKNMIEKQTRKQIKYIRTDNSLEFCSDEFNKLCKSEGIARHLTFRHTLQQNSVVERMNRIIMKKIFGCPAYAHVDNGKLEPRSIKCVFLSYKAGVKGYKLWCPENRKVVISRDVVFDETTMLPNLSLKDFSNKENQNQILRVDFTDVFSPVVKHISIRALLGIVAMHDLELRQLDIKTVFLYGEFEEVIYMQQPEGFIVSKKEDYVCLLKKSLYGLKQSPRHWYKRFDSFMTSHDFKRSSFGSCVCFKKNSDSSFMYLLLYVDDMLIVAKDKGDRRKVKAQLSEEFEIKDLRLAKKILGIEILRNRKASKLYLSQKGYIEYMSHVLYSSAVGSLMYATLCSRPDLSYAISVASKYMANPGKEHWKAVQWILRYLRGTINVFYNLEELEMESLGMLMLILLETFIEDDLSQVMSLQLEVVQSAGKPLCKLQSLCLPLNLSTWRLLRLVKKLLG
ncbi:hypothetical protein CXB51_035701 [Gossypium anomalum]|uniref:Integrase catalytic domain-containing protein n=1 Tax=Gossypium anomalum TaxID=47600 RepID=A0A8J6CJP8_9ROSI|nr:hypothetical protein CXB51_035701 [Gossypium anomalum]